MDPIFLILSLFFPRITMLIFWFINQYPPNTVPWLGDIILGVLIPRVLILIYIAQNLGTDSMWFWIHLVVAILNYLFGGKWYRGRRNRD